jgi:hypothetical protein
MLTWRRYPTAAGTPACDITTSSNLARNRGAAATTPDGAQHREHGTAHDGESDDADDQP